MTTKLNELIEYKLLVEWKPFDDYPEPLYCLYGGEVSIYVKGLTKEPVKIKESEYDR